MIVGVGEGIMTLAVRVMTSPPPLMIAAFTIMPGVAVIFTVAPNVMLTVADALRVPVQVITPLAKP